jgi:hypothetical protein
LNKMKLKKGACFGLAMAGGISSLFANLYPHLHIPLCGCACDIYLGPQFSPPHCHCHYHCHLIGCIQNPRASQALLDASPKHPKTPQDN